MSAPVDGDARRQDVAQREIAKLISELESSRLQGRQLSTTDHLLTLRRLAEHGRILTLELLLPVALRLNGAPYHLQDHFPFSPVFKVQMPKNLVIKSGRQLSKSTSLASHGILLANCIPNFRTLFVTPLYEQIRRFSNNYVRPFIEQSPIKSLWSNTGTENSVLQRSFRNLSTMIFSFALLDADRVRGVSADRVGIDEVQDMDPDHIPIIRETMSYSKYGLMQFTGTPKSLDNPLEGLWQQSSQAEWFIPCFNCGEWNIPSLEYHLDRMIGPFHELISERRPGTVCHKCQRPINPRHGHWLHRYPDKAQHFAGYHIPQLLLPLHYARPDKWNELLLKREGWGNTSLNTFYNEVLGESVDVGQKLVTETELKRACRLPWKNNPNEPAAIVRSRLKHYKMRVLAADWGGGGEKGVSFTVLTLLGFTPTGEIHCLWGKRLLSGGDHLREARECIHWVRVFGADLFAHDYTGAGWVRETVLVQAGFDLERVMGMNYCRTAARNLIQYVPPSPLHQRAHYNLDKARSILYTCQAIKLGLLSFFEWDKESNDNQGLISDFLAMVEEKTESRSAGDIYVITKNPTLTDDFAQAVNIGAAALWHANKAWPNFAQAASVARINQSVIQAAGSSEWGWDEDRSMSGYLNQP